MDSAYNPALTLLGIDPTEVRKLVHTKTYTQMFIAALLGTAKDGTTTVPLQVNG